MTIKLYVTKEDIKKYGMPGTTINKSKYLRAYCTSCKEPMRVTSKARAHDCVLEPCCDACLGKDGPKTISGSHIGAHDKMYHGVQQA